MGQGRIYIATDLVTMKKCVIKEAWAQLVQSNRSRKGHRVYEDFEKERDFLMELSAKRGCPEALIKGIASWENDHCLFYAMEFCQNELFDFIKDHFEHSNYGRFIVEESKKEQVAMIRPNKWIQSVSKIFKEICGVTQWLHCNGFCHLDLSLENTMISDLETLRIKVIDFGLAQRFNGNRCIFQGRIGKTQYMSPEAYIGRKFDGKKNDVYCLGVMLFMMLIGTAPYKIPFGDDAAFKFIMNGYGIGRFLKYCKRLRLVTVDALDLLHRIFQFEENRISMEEVMNHPFLNVEDEECRKKRENKRLLQEMGDYEEESDDAQDFDVLLSPKKRRKVDSDKSEEDEDEDDDINC